MASLSAFIRRSEALRLYRDILRALKDVECSTQRVELREYARSSFNNLRGVPSTQAGYHITEGRRELEHVLTTLRLAQGR